MSHFVGSEIKEEVGMRKQDDLIFISSAAFVEVNFSDDLAFHGLICLRFSHDLFDCLFYDFCCECFRDFLFQGCNANGFECADDFLSLHC